MILSWKSPITNTVKRAIVCLLLTMSAQWRMAAENHFANAESVKAFLQDHFSHTNAGMVIGLLDNNGSRIYSAGRLDNGTTQEVNADTVFEIGSITKTFTSLLLLDMAERGEMKLDDPVRKYLPKSVKVPARGEKEITLLNLAAQDSGLPFNADNLNVVSNDWVKAFNAYTADDMYVFLSGFNLPEDPGAKFQYSNLGMSLLGHVMELKTGTNFESLVLDRICRPLQMSSTAIKLRPELKARLATGHDENGQPAPYYDFQVMKGAGALCSTANDLLKYLSANLGLGESSLRPLMEKSQVIRHTGSPEMGKSALPWYDQAVYNPPGTELLGHGGGTGGFAAFMGFDKKQRRGVVVLSNQTTLHSSTIGWAILQGMPLTRESGNQLVREIVGLGFSFEVDKQTQTLRTTKIYSNSPASRAGLSAGLIIQTIENVPTVGKSTADCLTLLRAHGNPKVRLQLINPERKETNTVELTRGKFLTSG
jgi:D-alanyl-D-alanine-carboxypeptidase/D-alanyl-D-alanine-endopeptidase